MITGSIACQGIIANLHAKAFGDKCYRCGKPGHRSSKCPKRATVNLVKQVHEDEEEEFEEEEGDVKSYPYDPNEIQEEEEGELLGRSLVIQKLVLAPKRREPSQWHNIF